MPVRCLIIKYATLKGLFVLFAQFGAVHFSGDEAFFDFYQAKALGLATGNDAERCRLRLLRNIVEGIYRNSGYLYLEVDMRFVGKFGDRGVSYISYDLTARYHISLFTFYGVLG